MRNLFKGLIVLGVAALLPGSASAVGVGDSAVRNHRDEKKKASPEALFDRADAPHDGKVSKEEFRKVVAGLPTLELNPAMADKLFARLDTNKDGSLTKAEIKQLVGPVSRSLPGLPADGTRKLFGKLKGIVVGKIGAKLAAADKDKDGKLSKEEFRGLVASLGLGKGKAGYADKLFASLDTNKDGFLTMDEAKKLAAGGIKDKGLGLAKEHGKKLLGKVKDALGSKLKGLFK